MLCDFDAGDVVSIIHISILESSITRNLHYKRPLLVLRVDYQSGADQFFLALAIEIEEVVGVGYYIFFGDHQAFCKDKLVYI